ncbi:MAG: heme o synthase [Chloroflexi bacterium]|nr:heme o synthase [Chloroflexota bacterium]MDA1174765.1 heme o synthase [Chloroflexota bacterium]
MVTIARQIVTLSKPRIVVLLVFTGVCGAYAVAGGAVSAAALIAVIVAGSLSAAGANAINQGLDADIDAIMTRTRQRPVPAHQLRPSLAVATGVAFVIAAVALMGALTNAIAALLMLAAAAVYVFVYTILLKRRSWNNIVIGGAAGAFPPLIGATAVTGSIDAMGLYMFAFVFFWTPPHFWTLSILLRDDYAAASVPMLAAVTSQRATAIQIALYVVLLLVMAWLPVVSGFGGVGFGVVTTLMSIEWLRRSKPLFGETTRKQTLSAYKFSLLYLAIVFLVLAVEPALPWA